MSETSRTKPPSDAGMHLPFLDALRGMAALGVVFYHARDNIIGAVPSLADSPFYRLFAYGNLGVEVFFVISGYCIIAAAISGLQKNKGIGDFAGARIREDISAVLGVMVVQIALAWAMLVLVRRHVIHASSLSDLASGKFGALFYFANVTLTQLVFGEMLMSIVAWTLCYEAAFYAICAVGLAVAARVRSGRELLLLRLLHGLTVAILLAQIALPGRLSYPLDMWAMFGLGIGLYHLIRAERREPGEAREAAGAVGAIVLLMSGVMIRAGHSTVSPLHHLAAVAFAVTLGTVGLLWSVRKMTPKAVTSGVWRPLSAVGVFSYSLYLIHFPCIGMANQALRIAHLPDSWHVVRLLLMVGISLLGGWLFFMMAERPFMTLRRIPSPESPAAAPVLTPVAEAAP